MKQIEIVINFDTDKSLYKVYEPTTNTLLVSANLTEALLNLNKFLVDQSFITGDILQQNNISYHIDSPTMISIIEGNMNLLKRLSSAPSGFTLSGQKFGGSMSSPKQKQPSQGYSDKGGKRNKVSTSNWSRGFNESRKKFGSK